MKNYTIFIIILIVFSSCARYSNLYDVKPVNNDIKNNNFYEFENDTVKITYSFWGDKGNMSFTLLNKLNVPIYIDWKKSFLIKNNQHYNYWLDESITTGKMNVYNTATFIGNISSFYKSSSISASISMKTFKPERITFLLPNTEVSRIQTDLFDLKIENVSNQAAKGNLLCDDSITSAPILFEKYSVSNSPLVFKNFITISLTEKFDNEFYIENAFYVDKISRLKSEIITTHRIYTTNRDYFNKTIFSSPKHFYVKKLPVQN